jgi:hypothetical protein
MKLLHLPIDQIEKLSEGMVKEINDMDRNAIKMSWYMRGGVSYNDIMNMTSSQIDALNSIIEENLETTKKSKLPFF